MRYRDLEGLKERERTERVRERENWNGKNWETWR